MLLDNHLVEIIFSIFNKNTCFFCFCFIVPDGFLMQIIRDRLNQKDCITKGWIMIGFPRTRDQAESLARVPLMSPTR
jgi:hypothetical protein